MSEEEQHLQPWLCRSPRASLPHERLCLGQGVGPRLPDHAQVADLVVPQEVRLRRLRAAPMRVRRQRRLVARSYAEVKGSRRAAGRDIRGGQGILPVPLHEAVPTLICRRAHDRIAKDPVVVVSGHGIEDLGFGFQRDAAEDIGCDVPRAVVEVVPGDAPEVSVRAVREGVNQQRRVRDGAELVAVLAADPHDARGRVHAGVRKQQACDARALLRQAQHNILARDGQVHVRARRQFLEGRVKVELVPPVDKLRRVVEEAGFRRSRRRCDGRDAHQVIILRPERLRNPELQPIDARCGRRRCEAEGGRRANAVATGLCLRGYMRIAGAKA
mmetsp:Transcript_118457/g.377587  ORF Transcript_118457/g.377587 Transcript_118457/m.377587 type:complete len:329 (-) Transcript_118457:194-1180(-)